jgi:hypothetical protein
MEENFELMSYLKGAKAALDLCEKEGFINLESVYMLLKILEIQIGGNLCY